MRRLQSPPFFDNVAYRPPPRPSTSTSPPPPLLLPSPPIDDFFRVQPLSLFVLPPFSLPALSFGLVLRFLGAFLLYSSCLLRLFFFFLFLSGFSDIQVEPNTISHSNGLC